MDIPYRSFETEEEMYRFIAEQTERVLGEAGTVTSALANISSVLMLLMPRINWAGFYTLTDGALYLGPFQGKPAVSVIPAGQGVCGTAVAERKAQLVRDVHACCNHIACDLSSASEIVIPVWRGSCLWGVLDIDSPEKDRFGQTDLDGLTGLCSRLGEWLEQTAAAGLN